MSMRSAPITVEMAIQNHNLGVNVSDAGTLDGHPAEDFALVDHTHNAEDITSGIMNPNRLPTATNNSAGVVMLNGSSQSDSTSTAATPSAVNDVRQLLANKADSNHGHSPSDISGGTFPDKMRASYGSGNETDPQMRNSYISTSDPDNSYGSDGDIWYKIDKS